MAQLLISFSQTIAISIKKSQSFETGISDRHHLICTVLKSKYECMPPYNHYLSILQKLYERAV